MSISRAVTNFIPRTPLHGSLSRLIGGLDCKGNGTNHPLISVEPFILCDSAKEIIGAGKPPFGFHPHHGLIAMTYVLSGAFDDEDNLGDGEVHVNEAGSMYLVSSGKGLCHSEKSVMEGINGAMQTIVRIPRDKLHILPQISRVAASDLPIIPLEGGSSFKLLVGTTAGVASPAHVDAMPRFVLGHVEVAIGSTVQIPLDSDLNHGFLTVLKGSVDGSTVGGYNMHEEEGIYLFESGETLEVCNASSSNAIHLFIGAGINDNDEWVKLLGHNGFIIAKDEKEADVIMSTIGEKGNKFTFKDLE